MATILLRLDPELLENPDLDIRYVLPDLLAERSVGLIADDGYDYVGDTSLIVLFLTAADLEPALACILDVVENVCVLGNDLRPATVVAIEREAKHEVVYPPDFTGPFLSD